MTSGRLPSAAERLLALLPQVFRARDFEQALNVAAARGMTPPSPLADVPEGPLVTLLGVLGQQLDLLEAEVDWLYEDQFIETCADWVVPYLGALTGARIADVGDPVSARLQVANAVRDRRAKGTARALAGRAHAVMAAPSEAVEYAAHVAATFQPNFPGDRAAMTVAINGAPGRSLELPTFLGRRVTELRDIREGGRFAPANVGARVWTARSVPHGAVVPFALPGGQPARFRFDPLGRDLALWVKPTARVDDLPRLASTEIPGPVPLHAAVADPGAYYGEGRGLLIFIAGLEQTLPQVCFCDLSDDSGPAHWNHRGSIEELEKIRIDPRLGRFVLPRDGEGVEPDDVRVLYSFGTALRAGGAEKTDDILSDEAQLRALLNDRDRRAGVPIRLDQARRVAGDTPPPEAAARLQQALADFALMPAVQLEFGGTTALPAALTLPDEGDFELRAGEEVWPTVRGALRVEGGAGSTLTLRGLRLAADVRVAEGGLRQLTLIDCTVVPGMGQIRIDEPGCKLLLVRSIVGAIRVAHSVPIDAVESLVDSAAPDEPAVSAPDGSHAGLLWALRCTFLGDVQLRAFDEVSDSLFASRPNRGLARPSVSAQRLQTGCVRYSAVPREAAVPGRYRCFPAEGDTSSPAPVFASLEYGHSSYGVLVSANAAPLHFGAENGGEMGIGNRTSFQRRKRVLDADLAEWVPFGMAASTELMSD